MDQRSSQRKRTILDGRIIFNNRSSVISCTVRDLSETGARIAFGHVISIPLEFEMEVPKRGLSVTARVMWSNGNEHGVMFIDGQNAGAGEAPEEAAEGAQAAHRSQAERSAAEAAIVQAILDEAQRQIARAMGIPAETIRLKLDIDPARTAPEKN